MNNNQPQHPEQQHQPPVQQPAPPGPPAYAQAPPSPIPGMTAYAGPGAFPYAPPAPKVKREITARDRLLLLAALAVGILFDRLIANQMLSPWLNYRFYSGIFWLGYLVILYIVQWQRLKGNRALWVVAGLAAALCCWNFVFDYRSEFGALTWYVVPGVLMAHAGMFHGGYRLGQAGSIAAEWFYGWVIKPFSAIGIFFSAISATFRGEKQNTAKKVLVAAAVSIPLLGVVVPLLGSADQVFGYFLSNLFVEIDIGSLVWHSIVIIIATMLFYSFLWNIGQPDTVLSRGQSKSLNLDTLVCGIVLGMLLVVYLLFCAVQFTYLFARAGLPIDMTYSEYAREGFWQLILIVGLNLLLFATTLKHGKPHRALTVELVILLGVTAVILLSGGIRLSLYIRSYGLTWLRLLSAWFILYLGAVLVMCAVRLIKEQLPLIGVCAVMLLAWYTVLGYTDPDAVIVRYNLDLAEQPAQWVEQNFGYLSSRSDNGTLVLLGSDIGEENLARIVYDSPLDRLADNGLSYSSARARKAIAACRQAVPEPKQEDVPQDHYYFSREPHLFDG